MKIENLKKNNLVEIGRLYFLNNLQVIYFNIIIVNLVICLSKKQNHSVIHYIEIPTQLWRYTALW